MTNTRADPPTGQVELELELELDMMCQDRIPLKPNNVPGKGTMRLADRDLKNSGVSWP